MRAHWWSHLISFPRLQVDELMDRVSSLSAPRIDRHQVDPQTHSITASKCISEFHHRGVQMHLQTRSITSSKWISELHSLSLQMHLHTRWITAFKCISEFNLISASKCMSEFLDLGLQVHLETHSITGPSSSMSYSMFATKYISKLAQLRPPSASPNSIDHGFQGHLQNDSITASKCISKLAQFRPWRTSLSSVDDTLPLLLHTRLIMASQCISEITRSSTSGTPRTALKHRQQPVLIYRV